MKKIISFLTVILLYAANLHAQVKIGDNPASVNSNSLLELESTTKGLLLPRFTTDQMNAIAPPNGMVVYNSTANCLYIRKSGFWSKLTDLPLKDTLNVASGFILDLYNSNVNGSGIRSSVQAGNTAFYGKSVTGYALFATSADGIGVGGESSTGTGVRGGSTTGTAIEGISTSGISVMGRSNTSATGGHFSSASGYALITSTGNVGIATANPAYPLTVTSTGTGIVNKSGPVEVGTYVDGTSAFIQTYSNHPLYFSTNNGSAQLALSTAGRLGIGTTAPDASLHVKRVGTSTTAQFDGTNNNSFFNFGAGEHTYINGGKPTSLVIINDVSSGDVVMASGGGKVQIGDFSSSSRVTVEGAVAADNYVYRTTKTSYYSLNSADFHAKSSSEGLSRSPSIGTHGIFMFSGSFGLMAPVHLPNNATVTNMKLSFTDTDVKNLQILLVQYNPDTGDQTTLATLTSSGTPGQSSINTSFTSTINNQTYSYYILARTADGSAWPGANIVLNGILLTYTTAAAQ